MSLAEILEELPRLTPEQRHQVVEKVLALEGDWIEDDEALSPEERRLVESRLAAHDRDPRLRVAVGGCEGTAESALHSMSFRLVLRPEVELDISDAAARYENQRTGLGG